MPIGDKQPKMTRDEFIAWRNLRKGAGGSLTRWNGGSLPKSDALGNSFGAVPAVNKTVIQKPKRVHTPERYAFAPKNIRDIIKQNRKNLIERVKILDLMKKEESEDEK